MLQYTYKINEGQQVELVFINIILHVTASLAVSFNSYSLFYLILSPFYSVFYCL